MYQLRSRCRHQRSPSEPPVARDRSPQTQPTRDRSPQTQPSGPQLLPFSEEHIAFTPLASSSNQGQNSFLRAVGTLEPSIEFELAPVLNEEQCTILSTALQHKCRDNQLTDPYFTNEEWERALKESNNDVLKLCKCVAHETSDAWYHITCSLIDISPPLNDDSGSRVISILLPYIFQVAGLTNMRFQATRAGTLNTMRYILQLPSGESFMYTGYPDFKVVGRCGMRERRLGRRVLKLCGIGEVQSPPGTSAKAKTAALGQAGIYSVGQFVKCMNENEMCPGKLPVILLYKDLSVQVAMATLTKSRATIEASLGEISYKLVHSVVPYQLQSKEDIGDFASVFVRVVSDAMEAN